MHWDVFLYFLYMTISILFVRPAPLLLSLAMRAFHDGVKVDAATNKR
jgi:hypothetical protein